jgi:CubicO group peptidase (beta-lactamase class C family)
MPVATPSPSEARAVTRVSRVGGVLLIAAIVSSCAAAQGSPGGGPGGAARAGSMPQSHDGIREYLTRAAGFGVSGSFLVAKDGEVLLHSGIGLADREKQVPAGPETVYDIGSITKQFTAAAILKLEEQGKLRVTDSIDRFFPGTPADKHGITIHHLLTHTSGLVGDFGGDYEAITRDSIIGLALASELQWAPGTRYDYSNAGYSLLGAMIEMLTGNSYERYLHDQFFAPLGMTRTGYVIPQFSAEELSVGYRASQRWGTPLDRAWAEDGPWWNLRANGGLLSTVGDMHRWHAALLGTSALSEESKRKMFTPHAAEDPSGSSHYGYGWAVSRTPRDTRLIAHNGGNGYFFADFLRYVDDGAVVILATNASDEDVQPVRQRLIDWAVLGREPRLPPVAARSLDSATIARAAGSYRLPGGSTISVTRRGGMLVADPVGQGATELLYGRSDTAWSSATERSTRILGRLADGDAEPLRQASSDRIAAALDRIRQSAEQAFGPYRSLEVLGTVDSWWSAGSEVVTFARFNFERGSRVFRIHWNGERIAGLGGMAIPGPARLTLIPGAGESFAGYNLFLEREVPINLETDRSGRVLRLRAGASTAERVNP